MLSLIQHSLCVGVVKKLLPPTTHRGAVRKDGPEIPPEGGHCQSVLRPQGVINVPLYF